MYFVHQKISCTRHFSNILITDLHITSAAQSVVTYTQSHFGIRKYHKPNLDHIYRNINPDHHHLYHAFSLNLNLSGDIRGKGIQYQSEWTVITARWCRVASWLYVKEAMKRFGMFPHVTPEPQLAEERLVGWSLTSLFSTNTAISETKGQGWKVKEG